MFRLSLLTLCATILSGSLIRRGNAHPFITGGKSLPTFLSMRGGAAYGRVSPEEYRLTPEQIAEFHSNGCVTIPNVLTEEEVQELDLTANRILSGEIPIPGKDFCDMSKPFGVPMDQWSLVNAMLPTKYYPPLKGNIYERLCQNMIRQLFTEEDMTKDYDQLLDKRPAKSDAVFSWHQDMAYWPGTSVLGVNTTSTATFSLALDDSDVENGCLRYVAGSQSAKALREHRPLLQDRDEGHAVTVDVDESKEDVRYAPVRRGGITIHDEWVVHGSGGNTCTDRGRRTYVLAFREKSIVEAERRLGFTHSHNDEMNWDSFEDGAAHRVKANEPNGGDA